MSQELRTLKDQAKRAGKNAKEEFRMKELEMCSRHRHETEDFDKCLRSAGDSAANAIQHDQEAAALERICKVREFTMLRLLHHTWRAWSCSQVTMLGSHAGQGELHGKRVPRVDVDYPVLMNLLMRWPHIP